MGRLPRANAPPLPIVNAGCVALVVVAITWVNLCATRMGDDKQRSEADAELEREIRQGRTFTLSEAIGRLAGPGAMKGASLVTLKRQAEAELEDLLRRHLTDSGECLRLVLRRGVSESDLLLANPEQPLVVLAAYVQRVLDSDYQLKDLVRQADEEWGRVNAEPPHFEQEGGQPHPDDPYTVDSVRAALSGLIGQLTSGEI